MGLHVRLLFASVFAGVPYQQRVGRDGRAFLAFGLVLSCCCCRSGHRFVVLVVDIALYGSFLIAVSFWRSDVPDLVACSASVA